MKEKFRILLLIICMGLFVFPVQNFSAKNSEMTCCSVGDKKDCCNSSKKEKDDAPCHDSSKDNGCKDCKSCQTCQTCTVLVNFISSISIELVKKVEIKTQNFTYISPEISDVTAKIWQPPKIG